MPLFPFCRLEGIGFNETRSTDFRLVNPAAGRRRCVVLGIEGQVDVIRTRVGRRTCVGGIRDAAISPAGRMGLRTDDWGPAAELYQSAVPGAATRDWPIFFEKIAWNMCLMKAARYLWITGAALRSLVLTAAVAGAIAGAFPNACGPAQAAAGGASETSAGPGARAAPTTRFQHVVGSRQNPRLVAEWTVTVQPIQARPGDVVTITVDAQLQEAWHIYALDQSRMADGSGPSATVILMQHVPLLHAVRSWRPGSPAVRKESEVWEGLDERHHEGHAVFSRQYRISADAPFDDISISGVVAYQLCSSNGCQPPTGFTFEGAIRVTETSAAETALLEVRGPLKGTDAQGILDSPPLPSGDDYATPASVGEAAGSSHGLDKSQGLPAFLLTAIVAGFAALLTPCAFPMIPITVSFFHKQAEQQHHRPVAMALVYCLGIVGTFTGLGLLMSVFVGAASLNALANNAWLNVGIAAVLVAFALSLLGLFEIRIPSSVLTYLSLQEGRGGYIGVLFMAITFTLTSFTCTFAFAGGLLAAASSGDRLWPVLGLLAFSSAFALPFMGLALFPSLLQRLPRSGGWMHAVKVAMGFIELGAAFKFLSVADQAWHPAAWVFDYAFVMSAWIVLSLATGMYLLGMIRLSHEAHAEGAGALQTVVALGFLGLGVYLGAGLFSHEKPTGKLWENIVAFAPPRFDGGDDPTGDLIEQGGLAYALDVDRALQTAIREGRPMFLDFTGVNCVNCRKMEKSVLSQPHIKERLGHFVRVQLYTDRVPLVQDQLQASRVVERNRALQQEWFGDVTLPAYVIIPADRDVLSNPSKILASFKGTEQTAGDFVRFLDEGLTRWSKIAGSHNPEYR